MLSNIEKKYIAEQRIIFFKKASDISAILGVSGRSISNWCKSREYKNYEIKWLYRRTKQRHYDLFTNKKEKATDLLDF